MNLIQQKQVAGLLQALAERATVQYVDGSDQALQVQIDVIENDLNDAENELRDHDNRLIVLETNRVTSADIDAALAPIRALIGSETGDADSFINTLREVLAAFANSQEGFNLAQALAGKINLSGTVAGSPITGLLEFVFGAGLKWGNATLVAGSGMDGARLYAQDFARLYFNATKELWLQARLTVVGPSDGQIYFSERSYSARTIEANAPVWATSVAQHEQAITAIGSKNLYVPLSYIEKYFATKEQAGTADAIPMTGTEPGRYASGFIQTQGGLIFYPAEDTTRLWPSFGVANIGAALLFIMQDMNGANIATVKIDERGIYYNDEKLNGAGEVIGADFLARASVSPNGFPFWDGDFWSRRIVSHEDFKQAAGQGSLEGGVLYWVSGTGAAQYLVVQAINGTSISPYGTGRTLGGGGLGGDTIALKVAIDYGNGNALLYEPFTAGPSGEVLDIYNVSLAIRQAVVDGFNAQENAGNSSPYLTGTQPEGSRPGMRFIDPRNDYLYEHAPVAFENGSPNIWISTKLARGQNLDVYDVPEAVRSAVTNGSYSYGELQGSQPAGSKTGMRFTTYQYGYEYQRGANGLLVWNRYPKG
ncbi:hypothetical protein [Hymenobacter fodinae]|uniref:Uncharacterized protein n=1 Tax=Hymenobacter fodinae TaxID=2510796 RepID=A0A4Z0P8L3_9BACT|nr:hypothetical protein [Hymenobacter fodinae]TGE08744.1 hypothetical protein EU556_13745 [Hymenobacter fodinae]